MPLFSASSGAFRFQHKHPPPSSAIPWFFVFFFFFFSAYKFIEAGLLREGVVFFLGISLPPVCPRLSKSFFFIDSVHSVRALQLLVSLTIQRDTPKQAQFRRISGTFIVPPVSSFSRAPCVSRSLKERFLEEESFIPQRFPSRPTPLEVKGKLSFASSLEMLPRFA